MSGAFGASALVTVGAAVLAGGGIIGAAVAVVLVTRDFGATRRRPHPE